MPSPKAVIAIGACACRGHLPRGLQRGRRRGQDHSRGRVRTRMPGQAEAIIDGVVKALGAVKAKLGLTA
jgi:Ni,Fe-hydrogenase III small subunit